MHGNCDRREFLRRAGLTAGGLLLARWAPDLLAPELLAQSAATQAAPLPAGAPVPYPGGRKNVLLIIADDLNTDLGCYGHPVARTPNIDRLASRSVVFDNAFCQFPICHPSRTSLFSGLRPHRTGVYDLRTPTREHIGERVLLPQAFRAAGYRSMRVDKVFHVRHDDPLSWDISEETMGRDAAGKPIVPYTIDEPAFLGIERHIARKGTIAHDGEALAEWYAVNMPEERLMDGRSSRMLVQHIRRATQERRAFFAAAGFRRPHVPWIAPAGSFDLFPPGEIPVPERFHTLGREHLMPESTWRQAASAYYACIHHLDAQVGVLLRALDLLKLWESTIVILIGDNGFALGERDNRMSKGTLYERSCRVPLIIHDPHAPQGVRCGRTVELLDLYPTLAGLCDVPTPELEGRSLAPLLANPEVAWDSYALSSIGREAPLSHALRDERYRLICDAAGAPVELYDEIDDPLEKRNLLADQPQRVRQMRERMESLLGAAVIPG